MAIFVKTIDHGSFRGAARELRLSPSVVSHHISQLEEHLGVALMYRSTRKLALTHEGERLLMASRKMLEAVEGELATLSVSARDPSGELRITLPSVLSQSPLTDTIAKFSKTYPRIRLTLNFSDSRRALIEGGFDIGIRMGPGVKKSPNSTLLFKVGRKLVASADYLSTRETPSDPNQIRDWDWLALSTAKHDSLTFRKAGCALVKVRPEACISANDAQALYRLARQGTGLAVVPVFLAETDVADGRVSFVLPDWTLGEIDVFAEWPENAPRHGLIHLFLGELSIGGDRQRQTATSAPETE
ncbi:LysR family transcriptional regulator [uncultured Sulfitobacter sp.]|uniref:LysR family transcriptional regulator n=1 Tax=uncultured Sulfitobacter sp. TaxID=191468 RepID=UPI002603964E|nr:LysR family transcriptional regulator [uncultured Sulfitobacter sp.]